MTATSEDQEPEAVCMGCNKVIEEGSVVAFGDSLFHLEWYAFALFELLKHGQTLTLF